MSIPTLLSDVFGGSDLTLLKHFESINMIVGDQDLPGVHFRNPCLLSILPWTHPRILLDAAMNGSDFPHFPQVFKVGLQLAAGMKPMYSHFFGYIFNELKWQWYEF